MTTREKVIKAVLEVPEEELDGLYELISARKAPRRSLDETLASLAEIRASQSTETDAAELVREGREELAQRAFRR